MDKRKSKIKSKRRYHKTKSKKSFRNRKPNILFVAFNTNPFLIKLPNEFNITRIDAFKTDFNNFEYDNYDLIILGGGKSGVNLFIASNIFNYIPNLKKIFKLKKKIFGICYGMQIMYKYYYDENVHELEKKHKTICYVNLNPKFELSKKYPKLKVRFNHKYYCPRIDEKNIITKKILDNHISIPCFVKFPKGNYGIQFHFIDKNIRGDILKYIMNN